MTDNDAGPVGGVLGQSIILSRHEEIFASGFRQESMRTASYELHLAKTKLILPNKKRYPENDIYEGPLVLQCGDVAFASTVERLHVPNDLCANLSMRFSFASKGVLALNGMIVDPGYGSDHEGGSRLHFILANVGERAIYVNLCSDNDERFLGDSIAAIQFLPVSTSPGAAIAAPTLSKSPPVIDELFRNDELSLGLSLFTTQREMREKIEALDRDIKNDVRGLNNVVTFGHFLLGTAVVGVVISFLLSWLSSSRAKATVDLLSHHTGVATELLLIFIVVFITIPLGIHLLLKMRNSGSSRGGE